MTAARSTDACPTAAPSPLPPAPWFRGHGATLPPGQRWLLVGALLAYAIAVWGLVPHGIGFSWRECDTQAIARNLQEDGFDPRYPRVDWRGDGDGAVECEFPLYQLGIAAALALCGDVEWPGRALSMVALLWAAHSLHRLLRRRTAPPAAFAGMLAFLASGSAALLATRVQPDALSLAFGLCGLELFVGWLANGRSLRLLGATLLLALASLQKPLSLQLGLVAFGWTLCCARDRLSRPQPWLAFTAIVAVVAAWLWHAHGLWQATGLSFGVIGGEDSKFPGAQVFDGAVWTQLGWTTLQYGLSPLGLAAVGVVVARRRFDRSDAVLLFAILVGLVVSLRYSYHEGLGPHYHAWAAVAGGWFVARALPERAGWRWWLPLLVLLALVAGWRLRAERGMRIVVNRTPWMEVAQQLRAGTAPSDLLVVRTDFPRYDEFWRRGNNFEDPRVFYQTRRRGFALASDGIRAADLDDRRQRGASVFVDLEPNSTPADVRAWLAAHAEPWIVLDSVAVHRLRPAGDRDPSAEQGR